MRRAISDQQRALDKLSTLATRSQVPDVSAPAGAPAANRLPAPARANRNGLSSLAPSPSRDRGQRGGQPAQQDTWSLGDLLARASDAGDGAHHEEVAPPPQAARQRAPEPAPEQAAQPEEKQVGLDIGALSRALDVTTASSIWSRVRAGQRGFMVRSIYTPESRTMFDGIARRYQNDANFRQLVDRFLDEFERELVDTDRQEPSGSQSHQMIVSDTGRVYLVLAHASTRIQ